jgi:threonine synthase
MKDESLIPTGSFKGRGAAVGVSRARELGCTRLAMATAGNAGASWSGYAAKAGMGMLVAMPTRAPVINRAQCLVASARMLLVEGLVSDASEIVTAAIEDDDWFDVTTLREPYRVEGKKTMGLELVEQLGWVMPDVIVYPTGGGVGLIGIHKALRELRELGWVDGDLPRLVAVQASGCGPVVAAYEAGLSTCQSWLDPQTVADGLLVAKPFGDTLVMNAIYDTEGCAIAVDDDELLTDLALCGRLEGHFICPEGAATITAVRKLRESGWLSDNERVVILNTAAGIKYPHIVGTDIPLVQSIDTRSTTASSATLDGRASLAGADLRRGSDTFTPAMRKRREKWPLRGDGRDRFV